MEEPTVNPPSARTDFPLTRQTSNVCVERNTADNFAKHVCYTYVLFMSSLEVCDNWNYMESVDPRNNAPKQITFVLNSNADSLLVNVQLSNVIQTIVTTAGSQDMPILYTLLIYDQFSISLTLCI